MRRVLLSGTGVALLLSAQAALAQSQSTATNQTPPTGNVEASPRADATASPGAPAATPSRGVEEIVVTAQRRSERLQNVPIAVTAVSAAKLESVGIQTTQDLAIITPGLSSPSTLGFTQPFIRGVGSNTNGPGLEPPVATYIDGVYIAAAPSALLALINVDRIEVLKGPQGTLFGRNATGGLIQVITKDPKHQLSGAINASYANYQSVTGDLYFTGGLTDALAADIAVRYEHQGRGYGTNLGTGHQIGRVNYDLAVRSKFLFTPTDATRIKLAFDYEHRESSRDTQHLGTQYPGPFNTPTFGGPFLQGGPFDINYDFDPVNRNKSGGVSLQINQDIGALTLQSITAYRRARAQLVIDTDLTPQPIQYVNSVADYRQFSQELQIAPHAPGRLRWVAGIYFYDSDDEWTPAIVGFGPYSVSPVPFAPVKIVVNTGQQTTAVAGYAQATYEVIHNTNFTAGVRYNYERKHVGGESTFAIGGQVVGVTPEPDPASGIANHASFRNFNYRLALDHKLGSNILGYISYNTGFKSGGFNITLPTTQPFQPETINAAEIGLKSELLHRSLRLNVAGFHYDYNQLQVGRFVNGVEAIYNGAKAEIYGVDADSQFVLTRNLSLSGGLAYLHARFTSFPDADFFYPVGGCTLPFAGSCTASAKGKRLPYSPTFTFNIGADYKVETGTGLFVANVTYYNTSTFYGMPDNFGVQGAYGLLSASLAWTEPRGRFSLKAFGRNLTDKVYAESLIEAGQGLLVGRGQPRTYGITAGYKF